MRGIFCLTVAAASMAASAQFTFDGAKIQTGLLTSIPSPSGKMEFLAENRLLGAITGRARHEGGGWTAFESGRPGIVAATSSFEKVDHGLKWTITIRNSGLAPIEVGDLAVALPMNGRFERPEDIHKAVLKHSFISGASSFVFWSPSNPEEPRLCLTTGKGTSLEYWSAEGGEFRAYLCSKAVQAEVDAKGTNWRIPPTSFMLPPGGAVQRALHFHWSKTDQGVRDVLVGQKRLDIQIAQGMTLPQDMTATIAIRPKQLVHQVTAEFPQETSIKAIPSDDEYQRFQVRFRRLGENRLAITHGQGEQTYLELFSTQPVETLIQKRGEFLAKCQHTDPAKWYRGLISEWNMETQTLLGPDNYDRITGWRIYEVTCDDPGLGKPAYLAAKNAEFPVQKEVTALDDYIEHFVWGGLQRRDDETYPYGIYGIPDWKTLRERKDGNPTDGVAHLWRCYDYPHIILLYHSMFRIAKGHPEITHRLSAKDYLKRAYGTAKAFFTIPNELVQWSPYETGYYNELIIPDLIQDLEENEMHEEAESLRTHWETKVRRFVQGSLDLFGSEYAFDSTGFESTYALADYAARNAEELGIRPEEWRRFMDLQNRGNLFCRGTVEPAYYYLGSDYRGAAGNAYTLSYMSAMGGGSLLEYGLHYAGKEAPFYLRLGSASLLSSWALMNAGTAASNYGYWHKGEANDGAAGGGFEPAPHGETWLGQPHHRGSWYYSCETDLGFSGYLRRAATILADDPIFGRVALGGELSVKGVIPRDGVRRRFYLRLKGRTLDINLANARFAQNQPIRLVPNGIEFKAVPNSSVGGRFSLGGKYKSVIVGGKDLGQVSGGAIDHPVTVRIRF